MNYEGNIIRPPSEANSIILQVTVGCSYNKCTFCGAYKDVPFHLKTPDIIDTDLQFAQRYCRDQKRVFLADGDVLILSKKRLVELLGKIRQQLPWITRISLYGNARAVRNKSAEQLLVLKSMGLDRVYMGLESGRDTVLHAVRCQFHANHASSYLPLAGRLPRDKDTFLTAIAMALNGTSPLIPEYRRAL